MTVILGGGISGLAAAYYSLRNPKIKSIILLEASNRFGGWIKSNRLPDGTIFEQGPRTLRMKGPAGDNTLDLLDELQLSNKLLPFTAKDPIMSNKYIYMNKGLTTFVFPIKEVITNLLTAKAVKKEDESVYSFATRRFGKDIADIISCLVCGIYAGDANQISIKYFQRILFEAEQKYGSLILGIPLIRLSEKIRTLRSDVGSSTLAKKAKSEKWTTFALDGGLELLPNTLTEYLNKQNVDMRKEHKCEQIKFTPNGVELLVNGEIMKSPHIISSLPARKLADLVTDQHPQLAQELKAIPTVTVGLVNLQYNEQAFPLKSFGLLVSPKEEIPILGVIFDSCILRQKLPTVLTVMMGGAWFEKYFGNNPSEEELLNVATNFVKDVLCIKCDPSAVNVSILRDCIPQYVVGHEQRIKRIQDYISAHGIPLGLCGSSYNGVGVNDAILSAKQAVSKIM